MVNSRIRRMMRSSISVSSDRLTNASTSVSRVLTRLGVLGSWYSDPVDDVIDHFVGGEAVAGGVRAEPDPVAEDVRRQILDILRVDLGALPDEQRPDLGQATPADDGARRRSEVDTVLDQVRRRSYVPVGFRVVRTR